VPSTFSDDSERLMFYFYPVGLAAEAAALQA